MADHWKLLANRLGAPGVDEPEPDNQGNDAAMDENQPAEAIDREQKLPARAHQETVETVLDAPAEDDADAALFAGFGSKAKSARSRAEPERAPAAREPQDTLGSRQSEEPSPIKPAPSSPTQSSPTQSSPAPATSRRKSSWESLASMFNIKIDRGTPVEEPAVSESMSAAPAAASEPYPANEPHERPAEEKLPDRDIPRQGSRGSKPTRDPSLSIFAEESSDEGNEALQAMFSETPRDPADKYRGSKPRVVDDLSWGEDDASVEDVDLPVDSEEEPLARRSRRRRRRRGGRSEDETSHVSDRTSRGSPSAARTWGLDETEPAESDDDWQEPISFDVVSEVEVGEIEVDIDPDVDSVDDVVETERRSNRRRRRGRGGRGRDESPRTESRRDELPPGDLPKGDFAADESEFEPEEIAEIDEPTTERDSSEPRRGRRRRRGRGGSERSRSPEARSPEDRLEDGRRASETFLQDLGQEDDETDEVSPSQRHRNIPTWADSIESLVEANIENRRRNDNRGGAPRGRPRGRR